MFRGAFAVPRVLSHRHVLQCDSLEQHPASKHGIPVTSSVVSRDSFIAQVDYRTRCPTFVLELLKRQDCFEPTQTPRGRNHTFHSDSDIPVRMQSRNADYSKSGFDRGHMAAAANHRSSDVNVGSTFTFANVAPQRAELNRKYWARVEQFVRNLLRSRFEELFVVTGSLFLPSLDALGQLRVSCDVLGSAPRVVHVPTHFYKVILVEDKSSDRVLVLALVVPNEAVDEDVPMTHYLVPLEALEEAAGIIFFPNLLDGTARQELRSAERAWIAPLLQPESLALEQVSDSSGRHQGRLGRFRHLCDSVRCELPKPFASTIE
eukprot:TRINITY_DN47812_c0_g1_i1.p1 TRINITY_DN47812_c0_g1~~TRINITY_DN47812_c0_g1_i1.p1  ORF type:complete len:319 (+),score=44.99 TRINITY_DN47812_c0_g1_i1:33-989(+)